MRLIRVGITTEVWEAAKAQHLAMQRLASPEGDHESISEEAVTAARFAGFAPSEASGDLDKIGELPKEHADRLSTRERQIVEALASGRRVKTAMRRYAIEQARALTRRPKTWSGWLSGSRRGSAAAAGGVRNQSAPALRPTRRDRTPPDTDPLS